VARQALYRKWRSQTFDEVVGQEHVTRTLRNALRDGRLAHAYLFAGPRGTGKTSTARILAKAVNCLNEDVNQRPDNTCSICQAVNEGRLLDLIEIDAASNTGVDDVRDLRDKVAFMPNEARYKVYVIDEVHMLSNAAFNALLKTLEEPPGHVIFVLATTDPQRVPATVRSRCQRFDFRRIPAPLIAQHLERIVQSEGLRAEPAALQAIARSATGSMRDAISLLDQLMAYGEEAITLEQVQAMLGAVPEQAVAELIDHLAATDIPAGLGVLHQLVSQGVELSELVRQIVERLRALLLLKVGNGADLLDLGPEAVDALNDQAQRMPTELLLRAIKRFNQAGFELRSAMLGQPQLALELAFLEVIQPMQTEAVSAAQPAAAQAPTGSERPARPVASTTAPAVHVLAKQEEKPKATPVKAPRQPVTLGDDPAQALWNQWDGFIHAARDSCGIKVQAALRSVKDVWLDVDGATIVLAFSHDFARNVVEKPETLDGVRQLLAEFLGRSLAVRCALWRGERPTQPVTTGPAAKEAVTALAEPEPTEPPVTTLDQSSKGAASVETGASPAPTGEAAADISVDMASDPLIRRALELGAVVTVVESSEGDQA